MSTLCEDVLELDATSLVRVSSSLTKLHGGSLYMEDIANLLTNHFYEVFRRAPGEPSQCSLVRLFKTCAHNELPLELRPELSPDADPDRRYLALLGSRGDNSQWDSRQGSANHQAISLESTEVVDSIPMISNLIRMLGLNLSDVVKPNPELNVAGHYPLSVFYVEDALVSPYIPRKSDFVAPYGIKSVVGFGGLLTYSDMFTIILFFNVPVTCEVAVLFKNLADKVHELLMPFQSAGLIYRPA